MNCQEITYEFVGLFNDLLPLLTVVHLDGEDVYEFADAAYEDFVLEEYSDVVKDVIHFFYQSLDNIILSRATVNTKATNFSCPNVNVTSDEVFFSIGFTTIWDRALKHKNVFEVYFEEIKILFLYERMAGFSRTEYGYGKLLKKGLADCIIEGLIWGLNDVDGGNCEKWAKKINQKINEDNLKNSFYSNADLKKLHDCLLNNYLKVDVIEDYFWLLSTFVSPRVVEIVKTFGREVKLVEYIYGPKEYMLFAARSRNKKFTDKWAEELLQADFSEENEVVILNHLLKYYSESRNDRYDLAKEYLRKIRAKGYRVLVDKKVIDRIEKGTNHQAIFHRNAKDSIEILLDYKTSFERQFTSSLQLPISRFSILDLTYKLLGKFKREDIAEEDVKALHSAFYKRICYEKENGSLATFLNGFTGFLLIDLITKNIEVILKGAFGEGSEWHEELLKLTESIKEVASRDKKNIDTLLAQMMYLSVRYLEDNHYEDEALSSLEKLVYEIDTKGFFASCFTSPPAFGNGTSQIVLDGKLSFIYDLPNMVYCTDNALYLLKRLYLKGEVSKASKLLQDMENTILAVDKAFDDNSAQAMRSIYKVRFLALRKNIGFQNEFDAYLAECLSVNENRINSFLNNLSSNSDFKEFSYDTKLRFVFYWITNNWEKGETYYSDLMMLLNRFVTNEDKFIRASLLDEIEKIKIYKDFLGWLNGKEILLTNDEMSGLQRSPIYKELLPLELLHSEIENFTISEKITDEERKIVENCIEIKLRSYSAKPLGFNYP